MWKPPVPLIQIERKVIKSKRENLASFFFHFAQICKKVTFCWVCCFLKIWKTIHKNAKISLKWDLVSLWVVGGKSTLG